MAITTYTNKQGETFSLEFQAPTASSEDNYWGYTCRVTDSEGAKRDFSVVIMKTLFLEQAAAHAFATAADPMMAIHRMLDSVEDGSMPISSGDLTQGWAVF